VSQPVLAGLENLAGVTGGPLLALSATPDNALSRIARETSAYYVATFEPEPNERSGSTHQIAVRVSRPGVVVRVRPDTVFPTIDPRPTPRDSSPLRDLLLATRSARELPLRVTGFAVRAGGDEKLTIVGLFDAINSSVPLTSAAAALLDTTGRILGQWTAQAADLVSMPMTAGFIAPPGPYRLRVAAIDALGRTGVTEYDLLAELTPAGPLKLGSLVLGISRNGSFRPKLQFADEAAALARLEIYGGQAGARVTVSFELATTLNGPAMITQPGVLDATNEADRFQATAAIPIGGLPAGDFVVRAIVGMEDRPAGRVVRTFRKSLE
jgi:hypothetical protein